jgi:hypothetical protein
MTQENTGRFNTSNEILNGRLAMLGFVLAIATEALTGEGIIGQVTSILNNF